MRILAIETSCDETAIAIVEAQGDEKSASFKVLGNALLTQTVHADYGGVFPALAKREHAKNLVPLLEAALAEAELLSEDTQALAPETRDSIAKILEREAGLTEAFLEFAARCEPPQIDCIAVTRGPGLEPALWVGINFARALARAWGKPLVPVNHMEGHVIAALASGNHVAPAPGEHGVSAALASGNHAGLREEATGAELEIKNVEMPVLALLISGGHTELVLMKEWLAYELLGQTRDDAVGEAFDKVARMLALPFPGGPHISKLAEAARKAHERPTRSFILPRPMIDVNNCDFSFAGLKTAVLYLLKGKPAFTEEEKRDLAREFEDAVAEVLWHKTARALRESGAKTLVIGGGVSANEHIRRTFTEKISAEFPTVNFRLPTPNMTTDNAVMIALAGYFRALRKEFAEDIEADGNLSLSKR